MRGDEPRDPQPLDLPADFSETPKWLWERAKLNPLFFAAVAAIVAVAVADRMGWQERWLWLLLLSFSLPLLLHFKKRFYFIVSLASCFALLHAARLHQLETRALNTSGPQSISGTVSGMPQTPADSEATLFVLATPENGKYQVRVTGGGGDLRPGDQVTVRGSLAAPSTARNPHAFDRSDYLKRNGLAGRLVVDAASSIEVHNTGAGKITPATIATSCRNWLGGAITAGIDPDSDKAAVIRSMVLGVSDSTPPELEEPFRYSGTMHLFAISGLHVGIFTSILWFGLRLLNVRKDHAALLLIPAVFFYAFLTGWRPSAVRAAVMLSVVLIGSAFNRQPRLFNSLGAAALLILVWDTHQMFMPGFQLSFIVLFSIALFADPFRAITRRLAAPDPFIPRSLLSKTAKRKQSALNHLGTYVSVSLAAWLGSLYPVWHHFGLVTPVSVIANIVLIPCAYAVLSLAAASTSLGILQQTTLPVVLNKLNGLVAAGILSTAGWFSELPGAHFYLSRHDRPPDTCSITVLDVGFGGACNVIEPPGTDACLIDTGSAFDFQSTTRRFLSSRGIDHTHLVFLTHADGKHVGGWQPLLDFAPPQQTRTTEHALRSRLVAPAAGSGTPIAPAVRGDRFKLDTSTTIQVLYPPEGLRSGVADSTALVLLLTHGPWRILFMSDSGFETEKYLLDHGDDLRCDVIVMGRHRSDHSGTSTFIRAASPKAVVTTSGVFPTHENVTGAWRHGLTSRNVLLFDHAFSGAVTIEASPETLTIRPFLHGNPATFNRSPETPRP